MKILVALHNRELLDLVRDCISIALKKQLGYACNWQFLGVGSSTHAAKVVAEETPPFNCLFADLNLSPDGVTPIIAAFRKKSPIHAIILTTGGGLSQEDVENLRKWKAAFLPKPFTPGELISGLRVAELKISPPAS